MALLDVIEAKVNREYPDGAFRFTTTFLRFAAYMASAVADEMLRYEVTHHDVGLLAETPAYELPSDMVEIVEVGWLQDETLDSYKKLDGILVEHLDELEQDWRATVGDTPRGYLVESMVGIPFSYDDTDSRIRIYPMAGSAGGVIRIWYVRHMPYVPGWYGDDVPEWIVDAVHMPIVRAIIAAVDTPKEFEGYFAAAARSATRVRRRLDDEHPIITRFVGRGQ